METINPCLPEGSSSLLQAGGGASPVCTPLVVLLKFCFPFKTSSTRPHKPRQS